jgi:ribosomal subunit interface protein
VELEMRLKGITIGRTLREQIADHLEAAFRRLSKRIRAVSLSLEDTNGPRGGLDKDCQITVQLHRGGTIRSRCTDADLITAINLATDRATHTAVRRLERRRKRTARIQSRNPSED